MTGMAIMGVAFVALGILSIFLRRSIARWVRRYFNRFGQVGAGFGKLIHPGIYGAGGMLFVIVGAVMVLLSFRV